MDVILETKQASVSMLQRRLKLGYSRAARMVDQMEEMGIVGPFEGSQPRKIHITKQQWQELQSVQNQLSTQLTENAELSGTLDQGESAIIERYAREQGYAKPNERVFVDISGK